MAPDPYADFRQRVFAAAACEPDLFAADPALVPEIEWQSRWFRGDFGRAFTGTDGEAVRIVQFGWWNRGPGPDFLEAVVEVDGHALKGAIELDCDARDWDRHGHGANPAYDGVVLHLFFRQPDARFFTRTFAHRKVTQVVLDPAMAADTHTPRLAAARLGRCSLPLAAMPADPVEALLTQAARHRAATRAARFERVAAIHGRDEAWYQALAETLGYHANREAMRMLAQRLPLRWLRTRPGETESLLFGHAGFLDGKPFDESVGPETRQYLRGLWTAWWKARGESHPSRRPKWSLAAVRPANHPHRRLAALAVAVAHFPAFLRCVEAVPCDPEAVGAFLAGLDHPFWSGHFTLDAAVLDGTLALVGRDRIHDFLGNTVLPVRMAADPSLWQALAALPASQPSAALDRAARRLLGRRTDSARFTRRRFVLQQGLLQVYRDFCLEDTTDCHDCAFPEALADWRP